MRIALELVFLFTRGSRATFCDSFRKEQKRSVSKALFLHGGPDEAAGISADVVRSNKISRVKICAAEYTLQVGKEAHRLNYQQVTCRILPS